MSKGLNLELRICNSSVKLRVPEIDDFSLFISRKGKYSTSTQRAWLPNVKPATNSPRQREKKEKRRGKSELKSTIFHLSGGRDTVENIQRAAAPSCVCARAVANSG